MDFAEFGSILENLMAKAGRFGDHGGELFEEEVVFADPVVETVASGFFSEEFGIDEMLELSANCVDFFAGHADELSDVIEFVWLGEEDLNQFDPDFGNEKVL